MNNPFDFSQFFPKYEPQDMMRQFQNAFAQFATPQTPSFDFSSMTDVQRKNIEAIVTSNNKAIECTQAILTMQAELFQEAIKDATDAGQAFAENANDKTKLSEKQTELMQTAFDKALKSSTEISELISKTQEEMTETISARVKEGLDEIRESVK